MQNVVQTARFLAKNTAIDLRKRGLSYSEIKKQVSVPKSTLSSWLKNLKLEEPLIQKLKNKRTETARANAQKKKLKNEQEIKEIRLTSPRDIKRISKRELWLMGVMLCWRERLIPENEIGLRKGVSFTSSDPHLVKLFLKWLKEVGNIREEEIVLDIFALKSKKEETEEETKNKKNSLVSYWSGITDFPKNYFSHIYFQKSRPRKRGIPKRKISSKTMHGFLRVRVRASSLLARQIAGWAGGIRQYYWG